MTHRTLPAIALVLGLALSACGQDDATPKSGTASDSPSPAADTISAAPKPKPKPSPTPTPVDAPSAPAPTVDPITVSLKGLPTGSAPTVGYLRHGSGGWELVRADGSTMPVARAYDDFAPVDGGGLVGMRLGVDSSRVEVVDGAGRVTHGEPAIGYRLAVTPDGQMIGWLRPGGVPVDYEVRNGKILTGPPVQDATDLAALAGEKTCFESESPVHGCLWVVTNSNDGTTWGASSHGIADVEPGLAIASDVDEHGYLVGLSSTTDDGSCSVLVRPWRQPRWMTCDYRLRTFSPDATRVSATNAYADGLGDTRLAVLGRDGTVEQDFLAAHGVTFMKAVWEDEDHLLVLTYTPKRWEVLRLGVDGSVEVAVPAIKGLDYEPRLVLPSR